MRNAASPWERALSGSVCETVLLDVPYYRERWYRERTRRLDELLDGASGTLVKSEASLAAGLRERTEYWSRAVSARTLRGWWLGWGAWVLYVVLVIAVALLVTGGPWYLLWGAPVCGLAMMGLADIRAGRLVRAALDRRRCPACGYDLTGTTPGIDPAALDGFDPGPSRCTECGSPWPLVPPALPTDEAVARLFTPAATA
jgi:hypothetical protein